MSDKGASPQYAEVGVPAVPGPSVGPLLSASRLRRGEELQDISHALRIRLVHLQAIEDGRYEDLPGPTYAIGFVRAYADHIGLDSEEVVRRFKNEVSGISPATELKFPLPLPEGGIPRGAILFVGVVVAALAYGGWYVSSSKDRFLTDLIPPLPDRLAALLPGGISPEPEPSASRSTPADALAVGVADAPAPPADIAAIVRETAARPEPPAAEATHFADGEPASPAGAVETDPLARPADVLAEAIPAIEAPPVSPPFPEVQTETVVTTVVTVEAPDPRAADASGSLTEWASEPPAIAAPESRTADTPGSPTVAPAAATSGPADDHASPEIAGLSAAPETGVEVPAPWEAAPLGPVPSPAEGAAAPEAFVESPLAAPPTASTGGGLGVATEPAVPPAVTPAADWAVAETETAAGPLETPESPQVAVATEMTLPEPALAEPAAATAAPDEAPTPVEMVAARPSVEGPAEDVAASDGGSPPAPGTMEAESDEQIAALTDNAEEPSIAGVAGDGPQPAAAEDKSRILVRAKMASWIQVRDDVGNQLLVTRLMRAGDTYRVPDRPGLKLLTGNAGALEILVDGEEVPPIGPVGAVRRDVTLEIERLREGTAVTD